MAEVTEFTQVTAFTQFTVKELNRLVELIPQTDPRSIEYRELLSNLEAYCAICGTVDSIINGRILDGYVAPEAEDHPVADTPFPESKAEPESKENVVPFPAEDKQDKPAEPAPEPTPEYDAATVKKALVAARKEKNLNVTQWLKDNFNVSGFQALPAAEYGRAMELLKAV